MKMSTRREMAERRVVVMSQWMPRNVWVKARSGPALAGGSGQRGKEMLNVAANHRKVMHQPAIIG